MTTLTLSIVFLVSLIGLCLLAVYGLYHWIAEMIRDKDWCFLAAIICFLLVFGSGGLIQLTSDYQTFEADRLANTSKD